MDLGGQIVGFDIEMDLCFLVTGFQHQRHALVPGHDGRTVTIIFDMRGLAQQLRPEPGGLFDMVGVTIDDDG